MSSKIHILITFVFTMKLINEIGAAVSPSCVEEAEGCMCPIMKKIIELKKAVKQQEKILRKINKINPTKCTIKPSCVKVPKNQNVLCPTVQKVVDCWENSTSCCSTEDIRLIRNIETILCTATKCEIQLAQPYEKACKNPKHKKPFKCSPCNFINL